jgi:hypothetical protein
MIGRLNESQQSPFQPEEFFLTLLGYGTAIAGCHWRLRYFCIRRSALR